MELQSWSLEKQQAFFKTGITKSIDFRVQQLQRLKKVIKKLNSEILQALHDDLNKSSFEAYVSEIAVVNKEIEYFINNLKKLAKPERVKASPTTALSRNWIYKEPYGVVLVIAPWNYPFQLAILPMVGAIAAGNCVTIKPSEEARETSKIIDKLISYLYPDKYVATILGDEKTSQALTQLQFDYIFFTGSTRVGKLIMQDAAKNLIPVTLELGGKSPCIVDETADILLSAKRIVWGKFLNAGQTCIAPDYIMVHSAVKDELLKQCISQIKTLYSEEPLQNEQYTKIINQKHYLRLKAMIESSKVHYGGEMDETSNKISPTLIVEMDLESELMQEEIFGPLLPIVTYEEISEVVSFVQSKPKPLALYLFSNSKRNIRIISETLSFGGGCINDTLMHFSNHNLPFGGIGNSGMNAYHGKYSFEIFTHKKSVLESKSWFDISLKYPPYKIKLK